MAYSYQWLTAGARSYVGTVNTLREAINRRATLAGTSVTLPPLVSAGDRIKLSAWLDTARTAIETILLGTVKYGRFVRDVVTPPYALNWTPWNKTDLLAQINTPNTSGWNGYVPNMGMGDWRTHGTSERLQIGYINELISACELMVFLPVSCSSTGVQVSTRNGTGSDPGSWSTALQNAAINWNAGAWSAPGAGAGNGSAASWQVSGPPYNASCIAQRGDSFSVVIPNLTYPVKEFFMPWRANMQYYPSMGFPHDNCYIYDAVNFLGTLGTTIGTVNTSMGYQYDGWIFFGPSGTLSWNNETRSFSNKWHNIESSGNGFMDWWGGVSPGYQMGQELQYCTNATFFARFDFSGYSLGSGFWYPEQYGGWTI